MFVPTPRAVIADRYELIEEIGRGGMGSVWRAEHTGLGSACAVKFMLGMYAMDAAVRQRFLREARAAARLQSNHIVRVFDVDEWQGSLYIAMELLEGETLASLIWRAGALSPELTCEIIEHVARALARAHAARLIHRDLKPENVFLVKQEPGEPLLVKVLDFGLAKQLDTGGSHATKTGALLGTPGYMSPEQALGSKTIDERSDLWSLAAVAYHCVTGREPFPGEGVGEILLSVIQGPLPVPSRDNPSVPPGFDAWWARSAQRDAAARPQSAPVLAQDLRVSLGFGAGARSGYSSIALAETVQAGMPSAAARSKTKLSPVHGLSPVPAPAAESPPRTFEPAERGAGTLQPASSSRSARRDGFSAYALGAVVATALAATGLVMWLRTRDAPVREAPPKAAVTAEVRAALPQAQPAAAATASSGEMRTAPAGAAATAEPVPEPETAAAPELEPGSATSAALPTAAAVEAPRSTGGALSAPRAGAVAAVEPVEKPKPSVSPGAPPEPSARRQTLPVAAPPTTAAPPPTAAPPTPSRPAAPAASEKKHERLGF